VPQLNHATWVLLALSILVAFAYGAFGVAMYQADIPHIVPVAFKAFGILLLGVIALLARSRLLALGLFFGAMGDALLAWGEGTFLFGAAAFLIGHIFYITLFLRTGSGISATLKQAPRIIAAVTLIAAAFVMTALLVPGDHPLFAPLSIYTGVLTAMTLSTFTLPASRWLAMLGAVLFFISDGFVAAAMFHPLDDPMLAYWHSFLGWMVYWAGQAGICIGALGLHRVAR
jgi:uncharacterized membrane protein YhhN